MLQRKPLSMDLGLATPHTCPRGTEQCHVVSCVCPHFFLNGHCSL